MVCRAFKKPSSSHKQSYEAWSHAYLVRERHSSHFEASTFPAAPLSPMRTILHSANQGFYQQYCHDSEQELLHNHGDGGFIDNHNQVSEIPQLDSPTTLSTSFATNGTLNIDEYLENGRSDRAKEYIDWKKLDDLLPETTSSSSPLVLLSDHELGGAQNPACTHLLGCFPDL